MYRNVFLFLFLFPATVFSQSTKFYDFNWEPCDIAQASFFSIAEKTDSGWLRKDFFIGTKTLQMVALYKDSLNKIYNGNVSYYYANGNLDAIGRYEEGKKEGLYLRYHPNGMMMDSG